MQNEFVKIVFSYLESRLNKEFVSDASLVEKFNSIEIDEAWHKDLIIKMDDEYTQHQIYRERTKDLKFKRFFALLGCISGLVVLVISFLDLLPGGNMVVVMFGLIGGGAVGAIAAQSALNQISSDKNNRQFIWKSWLRC
jgi:hypothetical protein